MSDLKQIREKLRDADNIGKLLESIGCEYISTEQSGELVTAQLPERFYSNNKRATQVRLNKSLSCTIRNKGDFKGGSIFDLISYIHFDKRGEEELTSNLHKSKEFICKVFGWTNFLNNRKGDIVVKDYTASLKEIINGKKRRREVKPNPVLPEDVMQQFYPYEKPLPFQSWIDEGISYDAQMMYGVGFDIESKRIVFPIRNRFGSVIGVKGRAIDSDVSPKYIYLYRCNISQEWFNWNLAHPYILMDKSVIIVESEKSCMKFASLGIYNTLAISSSDISDFQVDMVKRLGLDIKIYLAYDKDKSVGEVSEQAEKFEGREVYGIIDMDNLLGEKDSPIDCGFEVWNHLYKNNSYEISS